MRPRGDADAGSATQRLRFCPRREQPIEARRLAATGAVPVQRATLRVETLTEP
jgi:hypothetical protein